MSNIEIFRTLGFGALHGQKLAVRLLFDIPCSLFDIPKNVIAKNKTPGLQRQTGDFVTGMSGYSD